MKNPLIGLAFSSVVLLIAFGICGKSGMDGSYAALGLGLFVVSVVGIASSLVWLFVRGISGRK